MKSNDAFASNKAPVRTLWVLRLMPLIVSVCLAAALWVFRAGFYHDFLIGMSVGLLITLSAYAFAIQRIELNTTTRPADVQNLRIS